MIKIKTLSANATDHKTQKVRQHKTRPTIEHPDLVLLVLIKP